MDPRYWAWTENVLGRHYPTVVLEDVGLLMNAGVRLGQPLPPSVPSITLKPESKRAPADYIEAGIFRFVSDKLRGIIDGAGLPGVQYLPVTLKRAGKVLAGPSYWMINVLEKADCFDAKRSRYEMDTGPRGRYISKVEELILDESKAEGARLFHLQPEGLAIYLLVEDSLAETILRSGCTGCQFVAPKDVHTYSQPKHIKVLKD